MLSVERNRRQFWSLFVDLYLSIGVMIGPLLLKIMLTSSAEHGI